jgi:hypothetical protein
LRQVEARSHQLRVVRTQPRSQRFGQLEHPLRLHHAAGELESAQRMRPPYGCYGSLGREHLQRYCPRALIGLQMRRLRSGDVRFELWQLAVREPTE